jgi:altronate dehydratase small subunit
MKKYAKLIKDTDNVVTALADVVAGEEVTVKLHEKESTYKCNQDIPFGHKIAIEDIGQDNKIIKYGHPIGSATKDIKQGDWVHTHNVKDDYIVLNKDGKPLTWP